MVNLASKDILARLLATENITVQHANVSTASFHVRDRILTLPTWEEMEGYTYDHLVGHEVGHALYTPEKGWHDAVVDGGPVMRSFLNVVEDARIEKLIQRRYPGLRRSFIKSYRKMLADGFFGVDKDHVNGMNLIDRINVYFKCGASVGVQFSTEEKPWLEEIAAAETWEEVEDISARLFAYCKEEYEKRKAQEEEDPSTDSEEDTFDGDVDGDFDGDDGEEVDWGDDFSNEEEDDPDATEGNADGDADDDSDFEEDGETETSDDDRGGDSFEDDMKSRTEEELHKNIEEELSQSRYDTIRHFTIPDLDGNKFVVGYKDTIAKIDEGTASATHRHLDVPIETKAEEVFKEFYKENKRVIDHMAKEFEMRKKAEEYARASTAKTGVIDTVKMNNYLFEDDIFRKVTVVPEGKNHGILIYLDWSGSMQGNVYAAVQQMSIIAMFCRKVNVPFRVFIFTNEDLPEHEDIKREEGTVMPFVCLREIFCDRMRKSEFHKICSFLLLYGRAFDANCGVGYFEYRQYTCAIHREMYLCGTPLDATLISASSVHDSFKEKYRLQNVATFFITDGASNQVYDYQRGNIGDALTGSHQKNILIKMVDEKTKKQYRLNTGRATNKLIQLYKDRTGSAVIGYFIADQTPHGYKAAQRQSEVFVPYDTLKERGKEYRKIGYSVCPHVSYDKYFVISKKQLLVEAQEMQVDDGASKAKIRTAFKKSQNNKKSARMMLTEVAEEVS